MSISDRLGAIKKWLTERGRERALSSFSCGHCDRNAQCGREPSADCVEKHQQVSRGDDWRYRAAGIDPKLPYGCGFCDRSTVICLVIPALVAAIHDGDQAASRDVAP